MSEKIIITCDSTADLSADQIKTYQIPVLPLNVILGEQTFTDGIDIAPKDIYDAYERTGILPKTSAVNVVDCKEFFEQFTLQGFTVIHFSLSSELSATYNNCCIATQAMENVYIIDSRSLSSGIALLVLSAIQLAQQGKSAAEIVDQCVKLRNDVNTSFVVDNLEFLHKGGRCSTIEALGANLLHIKPCIVVRNGEMSVGHKYRGKFSSVLQKYIHETLGDGSNVASDIVFITHAGCDENIVQQCVQEVQQVLPNKQVIVSRAGCTISAHCGKDTLGVIYLQHTIA